MHTLPSSVQLSRRNCLRWAAAAGVAALAGTARAGAIEKIRARGTLSVAIYQEMPPFHVAGQGIDVELAQALAGALDVKLSLLPFQADENMRDDLRNMVWRGHYLGFGPADVLLHVPVDRPLMEANKQVQILAPYCRDRSSWRVASRTCPGSTRCRNWAIARLRCRVRPSRAGSCSAPIRAPTASN